MESWPGPPPWDTGMIQQGGFRHSLHTIKPTPRQGFGTYGVGEMNSKILSGGINS